jgi:calcineurin-like phosphoesterase family protein
MIFVTSDTHFSHSNIAGPSVSRWDSGYRDFNSVREMDDTLINNINKLVGVDDELFILGDFCFGKQPWKYRDRINCRVAHLILGNHDYEDVDYSSCFTTVSHYKEIYVGRQLICMSHYSHRVWNKSHKGSIMLYAHSHNTLPPYGKSMDVGVDTSHAGHPKYHPYSMTEILDFMSKRDIAKPDRH